MCQSDTFLGPIMPPKFLHHVLVRQEFAASLLFQLVCPDGVLAVGRFV
jgi:hypothetical protein